MNLSIQDKYHLILAHEEQLSYRLGREVISRPEVSVWMILVPVLFLHHVYKVNQYKAGVKSFAQGMLDPRRKALDMALREVENGLKQEPGLMDYFPGLDSNSERQIKTAEKQAAVIKVLQGHYRDLLKQSGQSLEDIFRKVYPGSGEYRKYLNRLEEAEENLYSYLSRKVHTSEEAGRVIRNMQKCSRRMREEEIKHFFGH